MEPPSPPPSPPSPRRRNRPQAPPPRRPRFRPIPAPVIRELIRDGAGLASVRRVARPIPFPFGRGASQLEHMYPYYRVPYWPLTPPFVELMPWYQVLQLRHSRVARPEVAGPPNPPHGQEAQGHGAHRLFPPEAQQIQEGAEVIDEGVFRVIRRIPRPAHRPYHLPDHLPNHLPGQHPRQRGQVPPNLLPVGQPENLLAFLPEDQLGEGAAGGEVPAEGGPKVACPPRLVDMAAVAHVYVTASCFEQILARELYYEGIGERLNTFLKSQWEPLFTLPLINSLCYDLLHDLVLWLFNFSCDRTKGLGTTILVFLFCVQAPKIIIRLPESTKKFQLQSLNEELERLLDQPRGNLHTLDVTGLDPKSSSEYLGIIIPRCPSLKVLILGSHATLPVLMAAAKCPLTTLDVDEDATDIEVGYVVGYLLTSGPDTPHAWSHLVTLRLNHCEVSVFQMESLLTKYIHLKTLTSCKLHIVNVIFDLLKKEADVGYVREPMNLRQISVRDDWHKIVALLRIVPKLSHMEMETFRGVAEEAECMKIVANMQTVISINIKTLFVIGPRVLLPDAFTNLGKHLQELKFPQVLLMSLSDVIYILMACPVLLSLSLSISAFDTLERDIPTFTHRYLRYLYLEEDRKEPGYLHSLLRVCPSLRTLVLNLPQVNNLTNVLSSLDSSLALQNLEVLDISRVGQITPLSVRDMRILCCRRDCDYNTRRFLYVGSKIHPRSKDMSILRKYWWVRSSSLESESI